MTEAEPRVVLEEPRINESQEFKPVQDVLPFMSSLGHYSPPQLSFLEDPPENKLKQDPKSLIANSRRVEKKLFDFGVEGRVQEVNGGPVITMYEFAPAPGVKISKIANLADDLTLALRSEAIRVVGPLPGKGTMGIEIPNSIREVVYLKEIIAGKAFQETQASLPLILGKDAVGRHMVTDLTRMPHLLIAGAPARASRSASTPCSCPSSTAPRPWRFGCSWSTPKGSSCRSTTASPTCSTRW